MNTGSLVVLLVLIGMGLVILALQIKFIMKYRKTMVPDSPKQQKKNTLVVLFVIAIGGVGTYLVKHSDALPEVGLVGRNIIILLISAIILFNAFKELKNKK